MAKDYRTELRKQCSIKNVIIADVNIKGDNIDIKTNSNEYHMTIKAAAANQFFRWHDFGVFVAIIENLGMLNQRATIYHTGKEIRYITIGVHVMDMSTGRLTTWKRLYNEG